MKELKIIQDDEGNVSIETMDADGKPITTTGSVADAIAKIEEAFGASEAPEATEATEIQVDGEVTPASEEAEEIPEDGISASRGKKLEDKMPVDKKKMGMRPKVKPDWSDYSGM